MTLKIPTLLQRYIYPVLALALAYFLAGSLGTTLALPPGFGTPVFPASGIALAAVMWKGYRIWPGILLGSLCMNTWVSFANTPEFSFANFLPIGISIGLGASGEALFGAYCFHQFSTSDNPLDRVRNVLVFLIISGLLSSAISASVGSLSLCLGNLADWDNFFGLWLTWWLGDAMGIWLFAPLVLIFVQSSSYSVKPATLVEGIFLASIIYFFTRMIFEGPLDSNTYPLLFMTYPLLIWAVFRFEQFGAVFSVLIISGVAILETVQGNNPFTQNLATNESLLILQTLMGVVSFTSLVLASSLSEKRQLEKSLKQNTKELENRVKERTNQLEETGLQLQKSKRFLETLVGNLPGMVYRCRNDTDRTLEYVNEGCYELTGYTSEELLSQNIAFGKNVIHPTDQEIVYMLVQEGLEKRQPYELAYRILTAKKELKWVWEQGLGVFSQNGELEGLEGFIIDISQQKEAESKLEFYANKLKRSNKDLEEFASLASHDLQEPLRKIIIFGDRLKGKQSSLTDESKDYLERMQKAARRMEKYISDLLEYSMATHKPEHYERVSLEKIVTQVLDDLSNQIKMENATIHMQELPILEVDPVQFPKLFQNLISNAVKYHRENVAPIINITSSFCEKTKRWQIEISDNGIGIQEKHFERIFKPFERLHGQSAFEGTGIGLAICEKIVSRHSGEITVRRNQPHGTTFITTLPEKQQNN
jgi:PAS domain S-box-containing protein